MNKTSKRKPSVRKSKLEKLEQERLFGANIDHYVAMHQCKVMGSIFHNSGPQDVNDDDIWESVANFIKDDEVEELVDEFLPTKAEQEDFIKEMRASYEHKFAKKPEVIDGNMKALTETFAALEDQL